MLADRVAETVGSWRFIIIQSLPTWPLDHIEQDSIHECSHDYRTNVKAELGIELLHNKVIK